MKFLLLGDVHGDLSAVHNAFQEASIHDCVAVLQLGDFGYGWSWSVDEVTDPRASIGSVIYDTFSADVANVAYGYDMPLLWLDGNHENHTFLHDPELNPVTELTVVLANSEQVTGPLRRVADDVFHVPRGTVLRLGSKDVMFFGGASSVDVRHRIEGRSWWPGEVITEDQVDSIRGKRADVLLSHDFPFEVDIHDQHLDPYWGPDAVAATERNRRLVSEVLDICGATEVYHGHLHRRYTRTIDMAGREVIVNGVNRSDDHEQQGGPSHVIVDW